MTEIQDRELVEWLGCYLDGAVWHNPGGLPLINGVSDYGKSLSGMQRIKAKLRDLKVCYELDYQPQVVQSVRHSLVCYGNGSSGEWAGRSEGDVLVQCALALIERGIR